MDFELDKSVDNIHTLYNILSTMNDYIFISDIENKETLISKNMANEFGFDRKIIGDLEIIFSEKIHESDRARVKEDIYKLYNNDINQFYGEFRFENNLGVHIWISCKCKIYYDKNDKKRKYLAGIIENLERQVYIDPITEAHFYDKCGNDISYYINSENKKGGIMIIDLDDFDHINLLNSYEFGDSVLRKSILDISNILPCNSKIYRLYGDKFIIIYPNAKKEDMTRLFLEIQKYTLKFHEINNIKYQFTVSAGITMFDENNNSISELVRRGSIAIKKAKETGKNKCKFYSEEVFVEKLKENYLINEFRKNIQNEFKGFSLVFQPICNVATLQIKGAEALLRYESEKYGHISPLEFIPILEESGLIIEVGKWVIDKALSICKKWIKYIPDFFVNINVSLKQSIDYGFSTYILETLDKYKLNSNNIILELTETCFAKDETSFIEVLKHLRENKIRIAIDDFGTGYSSLGRLQRIPIDIVKIDKSFVKSMKNKDYNYNFIKTIIDLCHSASLKVCIEGIETRDELEIVNNFYADKFQGYYASKPIPEDEFFDKHIKIKDPFKSLKLEKNYLSTNNNVLIDSDLLLLMMDSTPLCLNLWNENFENISCNQEAVNLFELRDKGEYLKRFFELSPEYQPCGRLSRELALEKIEKAFKTGKEVFNWMHRKLNGELIPCEITLVRMMYKNKYIVAGYTRDLRHQILAEKAMCEDNELLNELMDATPLCLNLWSREYENTHCNNEAIKLFDLKDKREYTDRFFELSPEYQPDGEKSEEKAKKMIDIAFERGENKFEWMHCNLKGELIPSEVTLKKIKIKNEYMVAGYTRDMRSQIDKEQKIRLINSISTAILNNMPLGYIQYDINGNIIDFNPEIVNMVGGEDLNNTEKYFPEFQPSGERSIEKLNKKFKYAINEKFCKFEFILKHNNGNLIHTNMTMVYLNHQEVIICFIQDLSEVKNIASMNNKLKELAYFDALTGVYNRNAFFEKLDIRFEKIDKKIGYPLILLDFDHFKLINDTYGHIAGDKVLQETIGIIKKSLPRNSLFGRYGGDEFLIQPGLILEKDLDKILKNIIQEINKLKIKYQNDFINISVSIGVAYYNNEVDYNSWIQRADSALYEVKANGRNDYKIVK